MRFCGRFFLKRKTALFLAMLFAFLAVPVYAYFRFIWFTPGAKVYPGKEYLELKKGMGASQVARALDDQGMVHGPWSFLLLAKLTGKEKSLKPGIYRFSGESAWEVLGKLSRGDALPLSVTFLPGFTFAEVRQALGNTPGIENTHFSAKEFLQMAKPSCGFAEGGIFPDTYALAYGESALEVLDRAARRLEEKLDALWAAREPGLIWQNPCEALVVASLLEKEASKKEERQKIAGVIEKRLQAAMPLQIDPTASFAAGRKGAPTKDDLKRQSPFNTYTRLGLPPSPIALASLDALWAALHPLRTGALYFVASGGGEHAFSRTLEEHQAAVRRYRNGAFGK